MLDQKTFPFPFSFRDGRIAVIGGDEATRGKIIQVLFTAPGERVNLPEFGCGLLNLVFEPNSDVLAATMEFRIREALARWMADEIRVDGVAVEPQDGRVTVQVVYRRLGQQTPDAVRLHFR